MALGLAWLALAEPSPASLAAGGLVAALGAALRVWGAGHLVKTDLLAVTGPYAHLRHPLYAGTLLAVLGLAAAAGWRSFALVVAVFVPFFGLYYLPYKERIESARLESRHGEVYARFHRAVPALWPRLRAWRPAPVAEAPRWSGARFHANHEAGVTLAITVGWLLLLILRGAA